MIKIFSNRKKKYLAFFAVLVLILISSAIITPVLIEKEKTNWEGLLADKIEFTATTINNSFGRKSESLIQSTISLKKELKKIYSSQLFDYRSIFKLLTGEEFSQLSVQLYNENFDLIAWNEEPILKRNELTVIDKQIGQTFFTGNKLVTYLSFADTIKKANANFLILISKPIDKHFTLGKKNFDFINISDSLSKTLSVAINFDYSSSAERTKDGRKYSSVILNNFNNKIGIATFDKPSLETSIEKISSISFFVQSIMLILVIILFGFYHRSNFKKVKSRSIKFALIVFYFAVLRVALFYFELPSSIIHNSLTDSSNFSSVFGFGMVRSPLELTITVTFLLMVILFGYKYSVDYLNSNRQSGNRLIRLITSLLIIFILLLIYRGLGASLRSVIFDSTIRYFRDFSLLPDSSVLIMCLNILLLGYAVIVTSVILIMRVYNDLFEFIGKNKFIVMGSLFIFIQLFGWIFDLVQSEPQGTPLIRIIFIAVVILLAYIVYVGSKKQFLLQYILFAFAASIFSVSLLTYYNSEIERESLKTTAQEITRTDEKLVEFIIYQSMVKAQQNHDIKKSFMQSEDMSPDAFILWASSLLYSEGYRSEITFYDAKGKQRGDFASSFELIKRLKKDEIGVFPDSVNIEKKINPFANQTVFLGSAPVFNESDLIGFVRIVVVNNYDYFNFTDLPKFLLPQRAGILSAVNFDKLKIFDFRDSVLLRSYGGITISESAKQKILTAEFSNFNEAWMNIQLGNEKLLIYLLKDPDEKVSKILAVGMEEKNFSWNLSDFFKIFFVHTVIIMLILLVVAIIKYKATIEIFLLYKTKLAGALLAVSLVPLVLIAIYFRNLTEEKNSELVNKRLAELSGQIESYINMYETESSISNLQIFEKAANDLNVSYTIYRNHELLYSTSDLFYKIGLLPKILNSFVFDRTILNFDKTIFLKENFEAKNVNSIYHVIKINGEEYIIKVSDLFNTVSLPLSDVELDIFLFGIFSLAVLMLFIFSTFLADQISSPIRKLTNATRSVGGGDLNVEINYNRRGEIKELIDGFNSMVKQIRQSQSELAQLERETAWKEMAKQVAHEIKNPLTPMRLNVQQLIASYKDKSPKFDSIFEKVTSTIISQIDILKNIASEFSNFARMPKLNISTFNAVQIIKDAINLFEGENRTIKFNSSESEILISADEEHLKRTIINLVRNSIQAEADIISINIGRENEMCVLRVADNGKGIEFENIDKIFDDNFTTKKSGMGIGLGIAKRFIENIGGTITVEKTSADGTIFLITIPIAE